MQLLVFVLFIVILVPLLSGLLFLVRDGGRSDRLLIALSWRAGLSLGLFALLVTASYTGLLSPHPL